MRRRIGYSILAAVALVTSASAQGYMAANACDVYVQVAFPNGSPIPVGTRVVLIGDASGVPIQLITNRDGIARVRLAAGSYRIQVSAKEIEADTATASFRIYPGESSRNEYVTVRQKASGNEQSIIAVTELQVPDSARAEFEKGMTDLRKQKHGSAAKHLKRAVAIFPQYAAAWNGLGVIAMSSGDPGKAESYFRRAIEADSSAVLALINLSRILLQRREYVAGEKLVAHAVQLDPRNAEALTLLAYFALLQNRLDAAIEVSQRVHSFDHKQYALVHFVAANAYERKRLHQEAAIEYKQYLQEAPEGPSAAQARAALSNMRASIR
jgi:tetratricopeptide (TPR) repeat protein